VGLSSPLSHHFFTVAVRYGEPRMSDRGPVDHIARFLEGLPYVTAAEVGCGTGRYTLELMGRLGRKLFVHFIDSSEGMREQLRLDPELSGISGFDVLQAQAENLPLPDQSLHCMLALNANPHFDLTRFFPEAVRTLRLGGLLFIYTRFRNQNERSIWNQHFPGFATMEKRLYDEQQLTRRIELGRVLYVRDITHFTFQREATLDSLIQAMRGRHYSTFCPCDPDDLEGAIDGLEANLKARFGGCEVFQWVDENVMITVERA